MKIRRIVAAYFSPTGNTETIAKAMAKAASKETNLPVEYIDFTPPQAREKTYEFEKDDLLIIGLPVYAGRLPNKILPFVQENLRGHDTVSVAFVCYGNRSFDDGLSELIYEQERTGFRPAGAAAFVPAPPCSMTRSCLPLCARCLRKPPLKLRPPAVFCIRYESIPSSKAIPFSMRPPPSVYCLPNRRPPTQQRMLKASKKCSSARFSVFADVLRGTQKNPLYARR